MNFFTNNVLRVAFSILNRREIESKAKYSVNVEAKSEVAIPETVAVVGHDILFVMPLGTGEKDLENMPPRINI